MSSSFYILDSGGEVLIHRSYRGDVRQDVTTVFLRRVLEEEETRVAPVFLEQGITYTFIRVNDVYFVLASAINSCPLLDIAFLRECVVLFTSYFKVVTEESIQDNFVMVYELLDEVCDFGYPQYTEDKVLKEYITQEGLISVLMPDKLDVKTLPSAVTGVGGATPWRMPDKYKYSKNEVMFDVVEKVSLLMSPNGTLLSSDIMGSIHLNVRLSGMPTLRVGLNDKLYFDLTGRQGTSVDLDDMKFHQCVRLNQFESERVISFIPPDGKFELLSYRLSRNAALVAVSCNVVRHGTSRVEIFCSARTIYKVKTVAKFIDILIPIPSDADCPEARCSHGQIRYAPESNVLLWGLRNVSGHREFNCRAQFHLPSVRSQEAEALGRAPIEVKFQIPYFVPSGFQVRYVKVVEKSNYEATPWVRYLTQSGDYQIRIN